MDNLEGAFADLSVDFHHAPAPHEDGTNTASTTSIEGCHFREMDDESTEMLKPTTSFDPISATIEAFAIAERRRNFSFLARYSHCYMDGQDLSVYRAAPADVTSACKRWALDLAVLTDCGWYTFHQNISHLTDTVPLRLHADPNFLTSNGQCSSSVSSNINAAQIQVLDVDDTKEWIDVCAWMRNKLEWHDAYDWKFPQLQHDEQVVWWRLNGKSFRLLDLPTELREAVYLECIGPVIVPKPKEPKRWMNYRIQANAWMENENTFGNGLTYARKGRLGMARDPDINRPNLALLLVSHQVHDEALNALWTRTMKRFRAMCTTELEPRNRFTGQVPPLLLVKRLAPPPALSNVQLEFSAACHFEFIGIRPGPRAPFARWKPSREAVHINTLKTMRTIRKLDFKFISPKHPDAICPWGMGMSFFRSGPVAHSCQKEWIDWFFTFALEHLRECSFSVTMSGCVKDSTRATWEGILEKERNGFTHNMTLKKRAIYHGKTYEGPIPCHCSVPCYTEEELSDGSDGDGIHFLIEEGKAEEEYFSFKD